MLMHLILWDSSNGDAFSIVSCKICASWNGDYAISGCVFFRRAEEIIKAGFEDANRLFLMHHQGGDSLIYDAFSPGAV